MSFEVDKSTITFMQFKLQCVPVQHIKSLIKQLTIEPVDFTKNIHQILYQSIIRFCKEKVLHSAPLDTLYQVIDQKADKIHHFFGLRLQAVFQDQGFKLSLKNIVQPDKNLISNKLNINEPLYNSKPILTIAELKTQKVTQQKAQKQGQSKLLQICANLLDKPQCFCENTKQLKVKNDSSFKCSHCNRLFHTACMSKKAKSQFCCYCHLQRMVPLKKVVKTVFVGLLRKSKRKHVADFYIPQIQANQRLQFRCLRLKDDSQLACLFPDVAQVSINGQRCHLFEPINKHSCLKYRKDEPFNLLKGDYYKSQQNRLQVSQLITMNRQKDFRQEYQNHLIGLYVVQDIKIDELINQSKNTNILGFSQSHSILQDSFGLGKDDQITCQLVKIPLWCPLTTVKIQIPTRGYYCTHYQCFDLKNYLTLISQSQNPRWKCPLCNSMAFQFKIDSILMEIIKETKNNQKIKEILFFKNGDYSGIIDDEPLPDKKNIRSLKIPQKLKPKISIPQPLQKPKPKRQPNFIIPENAKIIPLDQDQQ